MRHHHGDGDGPMPAAETGVPFNVYLARMRADIDNVRHLCIVLEDSAGDLPSRVSRDLDARVDSARHFMDALSVLPTMTQLLTPAEAAAAATRLARGA